jgi:hypothetical protein
MTVGGTLTAGAEDGERPAESAKLDVFFQELFLGQMVYPQEKGEIQFTTGYFSAVESKHEARLPVVVEYGITDRLQVSVELPVDFKHSEETVDGVGNIELETFWNFYNDPESGWACGVGFGLGLPPATRGAGDAAVIYEPFVAACRQWDAWGMNASAGMEVKDYRRGETQVEGEFAWAVYRRWQQFTPLLELSVEVEPDETPVRLAPGLYWRPRSAPAEIGVSVPIGLTRAAPDFAVFVLATFEFQPGKRKRSVDDDRTEDARSEAMPATPLTDPLRRNASED